MRGLKAKVINNTVPLLRQSSQLLTSAASLPVVEIAYQKAIQLNLLEKTSMTRIYIKHSSRKFIVNKSILKSGGMRDLVAKRHLTASISSLSTHVVVERGSHDSMIFFQNARNLIYLIFLEVRCCIFFLGTRCN